jgi:hypothetical protein
MGDRTPPLAGAADGACASVEPAAKKARVFGETKALLKGLLNAEANNAVSDVTVTLAFTMDAVTYAIPLPVRRDQANAAFPDVSVLIDTCARSGSHKALLKRVVRMRPHSARCRNVSRGSSSCDRADNGRAPDTPGSGEEEAGEGGEDGQEEAGEAGEAG